MKLNLNAIAKTLCVLAFGVSAATLTNSVNAAENTQKTKQTQVKKKEVKKPVKKVVKKTSKETSKTKKAVNNKKVVSKKQKIVKKYIKGTPVRHPKASSVLAKTAKSNYAPQNIKYSVFNYKSGEVLEESGSNIVWPIASLTKLMTAYVFVTNTPNLKNCTTSITEEDRDLIKNTNTRLSSHKPYACENLLNVMLLASDNYAASALARSIPGWSKADFIRKMNSQAKEWGLSNTRFVDSSGLSPQNQSSADDYRKLTMNVVKNNEVSRISSKHEVLAENKWNKTITYRNSSKLVREYGLDVNLSKTGYIRESGYNLVHLGDCPAHIGVVEFGARNSDQRAYFVNQKLKKYGCT